MIKDYKTKWKAIEVSNQMAKHIQGTKRKKLLRTKVNILSIRR